MKRHFKGFIILILLVFESAKINAQNDSTYYKYSIKTNALQWVVNEANVAFEYRFNRTFGLESTVGIYGIAHIVDPESFSIFEDPVIPYKGVTIRINPKFYILPEKSSSSHSLYISPMILLKNNSAAYDWNDGLTVYNYIERRKIAGVSLLGGIQTALGKHFIVDFYAGAGVRYRVVNSGKETAPSIHLGIKLGYAFKPVYYANQIQKPVKQPVNYRYNIKTSVLPLLANEQNLGFEYRISNLLGVEASIGTQSLFETKNYNKDLPAVAYDTSYSFRILPKIYINVPLRTGALPLYLAPMYTHSYYEYGHGTGFLRWDYEKITNNTGSLLVGYQRNVGKHIVADMFFGYGRVFRKNTKITNWRTNPTDVPEVRTYDFKYTMDDLHFGIKLGYGFKPI